MKPDVKRAIKALDAMEKYYLEFAKNLRIEVSSWSTAGPRELGVEIAKTHETVADAMSQIREMLEVKPRRKNETKDN